MWFTCFFIAEQNAVRVRKVSDPNSCGHLIHPGQSYLGLSFEKLINLDSFSIDPQTNRVINTLPRPILDLPRADYEGMHISVDLPPRREPVIFEQNDQSDFPAWLRRTHGDNEPQAVTKTSVAEPREISTEPLFSPSQMYFRALAPLIRAWSDGVDEMTSNRRLQDWSEYWIHLYRREEIHACLNAYRDAQMLPYIEFAILVTLDRQFMDITTETDQCAMAPSIYDKEIYWYFYRALKP